MKRLLITGATGFIGRNVRPVLEKAHSVVGVNLSGGVDLAKAGALDYLKGDFDTVLHLAGKSYVPESFDRPAEYYHANINGALTVAEFCRRRGVKDLIYANTYVYGSPESLPIDETHRISPGSPYHRSKLLGEELLLGYFPQSGTKVCSLRIFNLYGPHQDPRFLIPKLIAEASSEGKVKVEDIEPRRDFIHVSDFANLVLNIVGTGITDSGIYNVGSGTSTSVGEVIEALRRCLSRPFEVVCAGKRRPNEIMDCRADTQKVTRAFGWHPRIALEDGLATIIKETIYVR
jgi:nucleoside-diphosphate-sugar epimerase